MSDSQLHLVRRARSDPIHMLVNSKSLKAKNNILHISIAYAFFLFSNLRISHISIPTLWQSKGRSPPNF